MSKSTLCLATLTAALFLAPTGTSEAAPSVAPVNDRKVERVQPPAVRVAAKLEAKNAAAVPGETRNVEATLTQGANGVAGKTVTFKLEGKNGSVANINIGSGVTNAQGKATVAWKVPELPQAAYALKASFAGDDGINAASDEANFGMIKGITKFDVSYSYGALDAHGGGNFPTLLIQLRRQSDNDALENKTVKLIVNEGQPSQMIQTYSTGNYGQATALLPSSVTSWKVKLQFMGDGANQSTAFEKTYSR